MVEALIQRLREGDRLALSRLLTYISRNQHLQEIQQAFDDAPQNARVVALTGSGGVGKSSLVGRLAEFLRDHQLSVAVLACDPQSSVTGGALLGDRIRMPSRPDDQQIFIRSLATPSGQQGIAQQLPLMIRLLDVFGFDVVLVETVGAGQNDTAVRDVVDHLVVMVQPEAGDEMQWEKAGLLEVADVVVVHKSDLPGADHVASQLKTLLNLPGTRSVEVVQASAKENLGLDELWTEVEKGSGGVGE